LTRWDSKSRLLTVAMVALALLVAGSGCGRDEGADLANGKKLFTAKQCASCHALARANAKGKQGPDLDAAFASARKAGMNDKTVEGVVFDQISHVRRGSIMPRNLVSGQDRRDVAAYVGRVAGKPGKDAGELASIGAGNENAKPAVAEGGSLEIDADPSGALAFVTAKAEAPAGKLTVKSVNKSSVPHNIAVQGPGAKGEGKIVSGGATSEFDIDLKPGKYTFLCTVPGHADAGMKGELVVK
jgi:plastocyanin